MENNFENIPSANEGAGNRTLGQGFAELTTNIGTGLGGLLQGVVGGATKPLQSTTTTVKEQTAGTNPGTNTDKNKNTIFIVVGLAVVGLLAVLLLVGKKGGS